MKCYRITALLKRFLHVAKRDLHRLLDLVYWPIQDILLWGFTGFWLQHKSTTSNVGLLLLSCLVYYIFFVQIHKEVPWNLLDEFWSFNFSNLVSTPLEIGEWLIAVMITGVVKATIVMFICSFVVWMVYSLNIFSIGFILIPLLLSLMIFGWALGFFTSSCLIYYGQKIQILTWIMGWIFAPFVGVFYPVSVLPRWTQMIAHALPPTYVFKTIRSIILEHTFSWTQIILAIMLSIVYFICTLMLFLYAFRASKHYGFSRLERYE